MNSIEARELNLGIFPCPHLVICIDGRPLEAILHKQYPQRMLEVLVSTLPDFRQEVYEREIVWSQATTLGDAKTIVPILMCPDDLHFSCTLVVAEVSATLETVTWHRVGMNRGAYDPPEGIGGDVEWLAEVEPFTFDRKQYENMLHVCRNWKLPDFPVPKPKTIGSWISAQLKTWFPWPAS